MSTASSSLAIKTRVWWRYGGIILALIGSILVLWLRLKSIKPVIDDAKQQFEEARERTEVEVEVARRRELELKLRLQRILAKTDTRERRTALHELYLEVMR